MTWGSSVKSARAMEAQTTRISRDDLGDLEIERKVHARYGGTD